jgi:CO/xanthine dehydrogenase Mo-binding subunit
VTTLERTRTVPPQVGRSAPRRDGAEKARGEAEFAGDIVAPHMLHGKVLRSPVPHARVVAVDARAAEAIPGVA